MQSFSTRSEARDIVTYFKPHAVFHFSSFFFFYEALFQRFFILLSLLPSSHSRQSQGHCAGCRRHPACRVHLCLMNGGLKQTQLKSLSITVAALASFYPTAKTFRGRQTCSIICVWNVFTIILLLHVLSFRMTDMKKQHLLYTV